MVDASLFYLSAKGAAGRYSIAGAGSFISIAGRWASALQLLALATTLLAPRFMARNHELLKASCHRGLSDEWRACAASACVRELSSWWGALCK